MKTFSITTATLALCLVGSNAAMGQTKPHDELNYSASACTAPNAEQIDGNGRQGFLWDSRGFWANTDSDAMQTLICPVPFDMRTTKADGTFGIIEVRVNVYDSTAGHEVVAKLFAASGEDPFAARNPLTNAFTSNAFTGAATLQLSATPPNGTKYLWVEVSVPRQVWPANRSAVMGLRVNRLGF